MDVPLETHLSPGVCERAWPILCALERDDAGGLRPKALLAAIARHPLTGRYAADGPFAAPPSCLPVRTALASAPRAPVVWQAVFPRA